MLGQQKTTLGTSQQQETEYSSHRLSESEQQKIEKMLPDVLSLNFCCDIQFRIWNKQSESMDPSNLVSVVQPAGGDVMM